MSTGNFGVALINKKKCSQMLRKKIRDRDYYIEISKIWVSLIKYTVFPIRAKMYHQNGTAVGVGGADINYQGGGVCRLVRLEKCRTAASAL